MNAPPHSSRSTRLTARISIYITCGLVVQIAFWFYSMPGPQLEGQQGIQAAVNSCLMAGLLLGIIPLLVALLVLRNRPGQLGMGAGDFRFGWKAVAFFTPGLVVATLIGSSDPQIQAFYPIPGDSIGHSLPGLTGWFLAYLVFYIAFEFFYRSFLLRGIETVIVNPAHSDKVDESDTDVTVSAGIHAAVICISIQAVFCFLIHIGKPNAELWASLPASVLFGWIAWRSQSIWYGVAIHFLVGVANDVGAMWQAGTMNWLE